MGFGGNSWTQWIWTKYALAIQHIATLLEPCRRQMFWSPNNLTEEWLALWRDQFAWKAKDVRHVMHGLWVIPTQNTAHYGQISGKLKKHKIYICIVYSSPDTVNWISLMNLVCNLGLEHACRNPAAQRMLWAQVAVLLSSRISGSCFARSETTPATMDAVKKTFVAFGAKSYGKLPLGQGSRKLQYRTNMDKGNIVKTFHWVQ